MSFCSSRMPRLFAAVLTWICIGILAGCAQQRAEPLPSDVKPDTSGNSGYILASITKNGGSNAWVEVTPLNGRPQPLDAQARGLWDHQDDFSEDETRTGRLMFIAVPKGHYEITNWRFKSHSRVDRDRVLGPARLPGIPFFIGPGEVVYLGNVHIDVEHEVSDLPLMLQAIRSVGAQILDRAARDITLFRKRYVGFSEISVRASVKRSAAWGLRIKLEIPEDQPHQP